MGEGGHAYMIQKAFRRGGLNYIRVFEPNAGTRYSYGDGFSLNGTYTGQRGLIDVPFEEFSSRNRSQGPIMKNIEVVNFFEDSAFYSNQKVFYFEDFDNDEMLVINSTLSNSIKIGIFRDF